VKTVGNLREAVVAGQFYPGSSLQLTQEIERLIDKHAQKTDSLACILPHAGYMYSGRVAGATVSRINLKNKVILLGPNHTGSGASFSIMTKGAWQTPLGKIEIDSPLANKMLRNSKFLQEDSLAHAGEHSLEVELPFLQYFKQNFQIVPIALLSDDIASLKALGLEIAATLKETKDYLIIASTDMTHYEPQEAAERKDKIAIEAILGLDPDKLMQKIRTLDISMCGYAPVVTLLAAAKSLGATSASLIQYQTSGDITGDKESVVGYAGITIS
jgi:AmmeMemoRadiSam system protein B